MNAAVFLDRDNTLIHNDGDLGDPDLVRLVQGASSAVASLRGLGYKIVVITNQGGVARGKYSESDVEAVNQRLADQIKSTSGSIIDRFYYCPYHPEGTVERYRREHPWRKPDCGMILQAAKDLQLDLAQSWTIGDQMRDVEAGAKAGTRTILLREDAEEMTPLRVAEISERQILSGNTIPNYAAKNLIEAVRIIAQQRKPESPEELHARQQAARRKEAAARAAEVTITPPPVPTPYRPWSASPPASREALQPSTGNVSAAESLDSRESTADATIPSQSEASIAESSRDSETLRQILQELRHQRPGQQDFSYIKAFAVLLQMIALVCFLGALVMGRAEDGVFMRWMFASILMQLATIATLMFSR
ncbi:MAG: HAD family hydrolase [Phycisphaeraceae bacterium]|nr:HAD family hydrolase [Phycisphaeraceae bacterium]